MTKRAFISHITEEAGVAAKLKAALARDFLQMLDVFVSSDGESISAGDDWLKSIDNALQQSALMLILCSPSSIRRPWINFEAGAAWMRRIPLIPL
ncbi:MAG: toll/interleukin-1 receptor domain-containing protein, partial [Acidobacteria bacterium]